MARTPQAVLADAWVFPAVTQHGQPTGRMMFRHWWDLAEVAAEIEPAERRGWHSLPPLIRDGAQARPTRRSCLSRRMEVSCYGGQRVPATGRQHDARCVGIPQDTQGREWRLRQAHQSPPAIATRGLAMRKHPATRSTRNGVQVSNLQNGRSEIRTHESLSAPHAFQACALNHSATRPSFGPTRKSERRMDSDRLLVLLSPFNSVPADGVRFELTIPGSPVCRFSRPVPSTTRPPVRVARYHCASRLPSAAAASQCKPAPPALPARGPLHARAKPGQARPRAAPPAAPRRTPPAAPRWHRHTRPPSLQADD